jgi:hypothetical protein
MGGEGEGVHAGRANHRADDGVPAQLLAHPQLRGFERDEVPMGAPVTSSVKRD